MSNADGGAAMFGSGGGGYGYPGRGRGSSGGSDYRAPVGRGYRDPKGKARATPFEAGAFIINKPRAQVREFAVVVPPRV